MRAARVKLVAKNCRNPKALRKVLKKALHMLAWQYLLLSTTRQSNSHSVIGKKGWFKKIKKN